MTAQEVVKAADVLRPIPQTLSRMLGNGTLRFDEHGDLEKRCSRCREYWPADTEFFFSMRLSRDGLQCQCKACCFDVRADVPSPLNSTNH